MVDANPYTQTFLKNLRTLRKAGLGEAGIAGLMAPDMTMVSNREAQLKKFLGPADYESQRKESRDLARMQLGLALMKSGFGAMGARPEPGETPMSVLGRTLGAPLAADTSTIAGQLMQQRQALKAAERQEDRQLKLAALQQIRDEDAALRELAKDSTPKPAAGSGLLETPYYVIQKGQDGKWSFVPQAGGQGQTQVRQQKGTGAPYNIQTMTLQSLRPGQTIVKASDLGKYGLGEPTDPKAATPNLQAGDFNLMKPNGSVFTVTQNGKTRTPVYRAIVDGPNRGKLVELGTKTVFSQEDLKNKGLSLKKITTKAPTKAAPKGLETAEFKASFRGMLSQIGDRQESQGLGKTSVRFNAAKFALNPDLKPGENYPFERVVGVNQSDGSVVTAPLTKDQQKVYADNLRASYLNLFKSQKPGQEPANLNNTFIARELSKSLGALGLPDAVQLPTGVVRGREQVTSPVAIMAAYKDAVPAFATNVQETLDNLPFPRNNKNLGTGTGRLVLGNELGVDFGKNTVSPPPLAANADATAVETRGSLVRGLDPGSIQERVLMEKIAKGTAIGSKLRTSTADSRAKQLAVVSEALDAERERLAKALSTPNAAKDLEVLDKSLEMLARLQLLDYDMKQSGVTGFIQGPVESGLRKYFGVEVGAYYRTAEGQLAANRFIASMPITQQLFARDILREAGEQRYTNKDLEGAQSTLVSLGKSDGFNADTLRELTGYLKNLVKSGLNAAGTMDIPPATLEKAAMLGIDLKSITPKNNYYNPYFNQGNYAVTKQPVPQYSKQYMSGLRDNGIFGYAAIPGTTGGTTAYRLIDVDTDGNPIPVDPQDASKGFRKLVVPVVGGQDWKTTVPSKTLNYNRNYLLKTYGLDR
jgi:hypothetical protein